MSRQLIYVDHIPRTSRLGVKKPAGAQAVSTLIC